MTDFIVLICYSLQQGIEEARVYEKTVAWLCGWGGEDVGEIEWLPVDSSSNNQSCLVSVIEPVY
jgi:hypothetical protein